MSMQPLARPLAAPIHPPSQVVSNEPSYTWLACDLVSGLITVELPIASPDLTTTMGAYEQTTLSMPIPDAPTQWETATVQGRCLLACVREDGAVVWGGMVLKRSGGTDPNLQLSCVTTEGYLDRRYVTDHTFGGVDQTQIAAQLVALDSSPHGIGFVVDAPDAGITRDRTYAAADDKTVYQRLVELMGAMNGPEWTVRLTLDNNKITKHLLIRDRLGSDNTEAVFDLPGCIIEYTFTESYDADDGANAVVATGDTGKDDVRVASDAHVDQALIDAGWPRYEARPSYSSVTTKHVLDEHAASDLAQMRLGTRGLTLTANAASAPRFDTDWRIGDTLGVQVQTSYRHPDGFTKRLRAVGVEQRPGQKGTVSPILDWEG